MTYFNVFQYVSGGDKGNKIKIKEPSRQQRCIAPHKQDAITVHEIFLKRTHPAYRYRFLMIDKRTGHQPNFIALPAMLTGQQ